MHSACVYISLWSACLYSFCVVFQALLLFDSLSQILSSVQFSCSVVSDSLRPHGPQHTRPPCPSLTPGVYSNSSPSSQWCHPTISSSVVPFSTRRQTFPASGSFQISQFFALGGQSYWSFSFRISPSSEYSGMISIRIDWFEPLAVQGTHMFIEPLFIIAKT